jgi:hypothetical protein
MLIIRAFVSAAMLGLCVAPTGRTDVRPALPTSMAPQVDPKFLDAWSRERHRDTRVPAGTAKIVVVKFSDFECPACAMTATSYGPILWKYTDSVKYVVKDFPLNHECNPTIGSTPGGHEGSCAAAVAARLAKEAGTGDAMTSWLFDNQGATIDAIKQAAVAVGHIKGFDQRYAAVITSVKDDALDGAALGVISTPGFFINGVMVRGWVDGRFSDTYLLDPELFEAAIQYELKRAGNHDEPVAMLIAPPHVGGPGDAAERAYVPIRGRG